MAVPPSDRADSVTSGVSALVRVTVVSGDRRVDLVLPGGVPVAELLPELARTVGLLDAATVYGGYRLILPCGRVLDPDAGLSPQGVRHGSLLSVVAGIDRPWPRRYDDVVEATADSVERDLRPWRPADGRCAVLAGAVLLLLLGAGALVAERGPHVTGWDAAIVATSLLGAAIMLSRTQRRHAVGVTLAWLAVVYAAVAGAAFGDRPLTYVGVGALAVGGLGLLGLEKGRFLLIPAVAVGALLAACGLVVQFAGWRPATVLSAVLVGVVLLASCFPRLALSLTRVDVPRSDSPDDIAVGPLGIDPAVVAADARTAHEILLALSATVGVLLVIVVPLAVSMGLAGTLLVLAASVVAMLRTRHHRVGAQVLVGLVSGALGVLATGLAVLWLRENWRADLTAALLAASAGLLGFVVVPGALSMRRALVADIAETACLVALLPLLVVTLGAVRGVPL